MNATNLADVQKLSVSERIQLVEDIWDTIATTPEQIPVPQAQRNELDRRLAAYHKQPSMIISRQELQDDLKNLL